MLQIILGGNLVGMVYELGLYIAGETLHNWMKRWIILVGLWSNTCLCSIKVHSYLPELCLYYLKFVYVDAAIALQGKKGSDSQLPRGECFF